MARVSRNNCDKSKDIVKVERFSTAIYARLSAENSNKKEDRDIIANQVAVCKSYIDENPYLKLADTYIDNGQTGTNFDRPEFNRLMEDIKSGKIKCLIVRDLSRFGRDYIETGTYMERIFPSLGLRFISVNERYDSFTVDTTNEALMIPLQNMINTLYAKDISKKVFTAHRTRFLSGDFKRSTLPYGYKLDETRKNVIIDDEAAEFVRLIFNLRIKGKSIKEIIKTLEEMDATNARVRKAETKVQLGDTSNYEGWHYSTIQNILKNHTYIGHTVIGKKVRSLYKGVKCEEIHDESRWIILENTHEAIISAEIFAEIQRMRILASEQKKLRMRETEVKRSKLIDLFNGKIYCADCGSKLSFMRSVDKKNFNANYKCSLYDRKKQCTIHSINYKLLNEKVLSAIKIQVKVALDYEKLILKLKDGDTFTEQNKIISSLTLKLNGIQQKRTRLYEDFVDDILSESEYSFAKTSYDDDFAKLNRVLEEMTCKRAKLKEAMSSENKWIKLMTSVSKSKKLTQSLVDEVVEKVYVYENSDIEIVMKYDDIYALTVQSLKRV